MKNNHEEIMILQHEPWPGYKKIFWIVFILAMLYLFSVMFLGYEPNH